MTPTLRPDLKDLPVRMLDLPIDPERHIPIPWFVQWIDGKPEFRLMDEGKWIRAVKEQLCWCCGKRLGAYVVFVLGPMCGITRTTSEPPNHLSCARWAAKYCPFLSRPHMVRRGEEELAQRGACSMGGLAIRRNPGVALLWTSRDYTILRPRTGGVLLHVGEPTAWEWWAEGRAAYRGEVEESIRGGLVFLEAEARTEEGGMEELQRRVAAFQRYLP